MIIYEFLMLFMLPLEEQSVFCYGNEYLFFYWIALNMFLGSTNLKNATKEMSVCRHFLLFTLLGVSLTNLAQ